MALMSRLITFISVTDNANERFMQASDYGDAAAQRMSPVLRFIIILWRLPASVSPEQFGKRRGGNASANRGNKIPARISITSHSFCPSISSQNRTLFTSTPIIRSRGSPACWPPAHASNIQSGNQMSDVSFFKKKWFHKTVTNCKHSVKKIMFGIICMCVSFLFVEK